MADDEEETKPASAGMPPGHAAQVALEGRATFRSAGRGALSIETADTPLPLKAAEAAGAVEIGVEVEGHGRASRALVTEDGDALVTEAGDTLIAELDVIPAVWSAAGLKNSEPLNRAERELLQIKTLVEALNAAKASMGRGHNGPPELVDWPDIDVVTIDDAIAGIRELRVQTANSNPDPKLLDFIRRILEAAGRALKAVARWIAGKGDKFIDSLVNSLGTPQGAAGWATIVTELYRGQVGHDLHQLAQIVGRVGAKLLGI